VADQLTPDLERRRTIHDLENFVEIISEDISDTASNGSPEDQAYIVDLEGKIARIQRVIAELKAREPETRAAQLERLEKEIVEEVAEDLFRLTTELDNEVVEERVEDHLALVGLTPLRPMDPDDEDVVREYRAWDAAQRSIYRRAWLVLAKKLMDAYAETEG